MPGIVADHSRRQRRMEPLERTLVRDLVVAVGWIVHHPIDRQRDDRVTGHAANLPEGLDLLVPEVLEHLKPDEQAVAFLLDGPRHVCRIVDDPLALSLELRWHAAVHDVGAHDNRPNVRAELERGGEPVSFDELARLLAGERQISPASPVVGNGLRHGVEFTPGDRADRTFGGHAPGSWSDGDDAPRRPD